MKTPVLTLSLLALLTLGNALPVLAQATPPATSPTAAPTTNPQAMEAPAVPPATQTAKPKTKFILQAESEDLKLTDDIKTAKRQLKAHPDDPEANFLMAAAYSRSPSLDKAFRYMKKVKELLKVNQDFEFIDRTLVDYEALLSENPDNTVVLYRVAMAYYFKGYSIEKYPHHFKNTPTGTAEEYFQKARDTMSRVITLDPKDIWARDYLGYLVSENGKDWAKAIPIWEASLAVDSEHNPGAYLLLSQAYLKLGDLPKALAYGAKGIEIQQAMGMTLP